MSKTRTITLTNAPPVRIAEDKWPIVAEAKWYEGEHECQANRTAAIRVREHDDGRRIVYGVAITNWAKESNRHAGVLLDADGSFHEAMTHVVAAIHAVAAKIGHEHLADECIADLPPVDL